MANTDQTFGLRPVQYLNGAAWNGQIRWYFCPATDGTAIYLGDVVKAAGSADTTGAFPTVQQTTAGATTNVGVAVAFRTDAPDANPVSLAVTNSTGLPRTETYRPASTAMYIGVVDEPNVLFEAQEDSVGSTLAATDVLSCCDLIVAAGSTTTGLSGMEIDSSTSSTSGTLRIMGLSGTNGFSPNAIGTNAKWLVMIAEHLYRGTAGV